MDPTKSIPKLGCKQYVKKRVTEYPPRQLFGGWTRLDPICALKKMVGCSKYLAHGALTTKKPFSSAPNLTKLMAVRPSIIYTLALLKAGGFVPFNQSSSPMASRLITLNEVFIPQNILYYKNLKS